MPDDKKRYIFLGYDHNGAFEPAAEEYAKDPNCVLIRPVEGETFEDALKRANIAPGSDVYLFCHGGRDGSFTWKQRESVSYGRFFRALPEGTGTVLLSSCYGGVSTRWLQVAPLGAVIAPMVGPDHLSFSTRDFYIEARSLTHPLDLYLETLDNFDVEEYEGRIDKVNRRNLTAEDNHPGRALPTTIGIGGNPPQRIDLMREMAALSASLKKLDVDPAVWNSAIDDVRTRFESLSRETLDDVTSLLENGNPLENADTSYGAVQKNIALALTAAYLKHSGQFAEKRAAVIHTSSPRPTDPLVRPGSPIEMAIADLFPMERVLEEDEGYVERRMRINDVVRAVGAQYLAGNEAIRANIARRLYAEHLAEGGNVPMIGALAVMERAALIDRTVKEGNATVPPASYYKDALRQTEAQARELSHSGKPQSYASTGMLDILGTRAPIDIAFDELFGLLPGTTCRFKDVNGVGMEKLTSDVALVLRAARNRSFETETYNFKSAIYADLFQQSLDAPEEKQNTYLSALTVLYRAEHIEKAQRSGEVSLASQPEDTKPLPTVMMRAMQRGAMHLAIRKEQKATVSPLYVPAVVDPNRYPVDDDQLVNYAMDRNAGLRDRLIPNAQRSNDSYLYAQEYSELTRQLQQGMDRVFGRKPGATGIYTESTAADIRKLQTHFGLPVTGHADRETILALQLAEVTLMMKDPKPPTNLVISEVDDVMNLGFLPFTPAMERALAEAAKSFKQIKSQDETYASANDMLNDLLEYKSAERKPKPKPGLAK